jgi:hypothetical protein
MKMKKLFSVLAAAAFALSIGAGGCAKEKAPSPSEPAKKEAAGKEKKAAPKVSVKFFTGTIETLDAAAGTLTLKGPKDLDGMKIGDKVLVKHTDEIALSIVKPGANKNTQARKEKEGAVEEVGPVPQAE